MVPGVFDPETEAELKKIFKDLGRKFTDILVVNYADLNAEHHHHAHVAHEDHCHTCPEAKELADELTRITEGLLEFKIVDKSEATSLKPRYLPAFYYDTPRRNVRYYGLPSGQEFAPFIFIHEYIAKGVKLSKEVVEAVESIDVPLHIKIFVTPECPYCPIVVDALNQMGLVNSNLLVETIEAFEHPVEADAYGVQYVPFVAITKIEDYDRYGARLVDKIPGYMPPEEMVSILLRAARRVKSAK